MLYLFGAKIRLFLVTSKFLGENVGRVIKKKNRRLSNSESRLLNIEIYYDEVNLFVVYLLLGENHLVSTLVREVEQNLVCAFASRNIEVLTSIN